MTQKKTRINGTKYLVVWVWLAITFIAITLYITRYSISSVRTTENVSAASILPVTHWKELFDSTSMNLSSGEGLKCQTKALNLITDENLYHFGVCIDGLTSIYLATKDIKYIDRAFLYLTKAIPTAKSDSRGYKGWDTNSSSLDVSHGWRSVSRLLYIVRTTESLYKNAETKQQYDTVLAFTEKHVFENYYTESLSNETRQPSGAIKDSLIYRGRTHMASHWPYMAMYLRRISQNATAIGRYKEVIKKFDSDLNPYAQSSLKQQLVPNKNIPTAVFFSDRWERFDGIGSDMHHAQDTIGYIIDAFELGESEWTEIDIFRLRETLKKVVWKGTKSGEWQKFSAFMDGSDGFSDTIIDGQPVDTNVLGRCQEDGFLKLGRYDSQVQEIMQDHSPRGCMAISIYGNLALNAAMLNARGRDLPTFSLQEVQNSYDQIGIIQTLQAESYTEAKGIEKKGSYITSFDTGDWIKYDNVNLTNAKQIRWKVNGRNGQNYFQVRIDSPTGNVISYLHTQPQDDTTSKDILMRELVSPITIPVSGNKSLYLTAGTSLYGVANIDSFQIESRSPSTKLTPQPSVTSKPTALATSKVTPGPSNRLTPTPAPSTIQGNLVVKARGTAAKNSQGVMEYPRIQIIINDKVVNELSVTSTYREYPLSLGSNQVVSAEARYINDPEKDDSADRNVQIDYVAINGKLYQSEASDTYSVGSWSSSGCDGGYKQSEWLHCNGYFKYLVLPERKSETVEAEAFTKTGGTVVVSGQETKPGVIVQDGYIRRFDPNDFITYTLKYPLKSYNQITLYLKSRNTGGIIEILAGSEGGEVIGSQEGFRPAGLTIPEWQKHTIQINPGSYEGNIVTLRSKDMYEVAYIDKLYFDNSKL